MRKGDEAMHDELIAMVTVFAESNGTPDEQQLYDAGHRGRKVDVALAMGARLAYELLGSAAGLAGIINRERMTEAEAWRRFMIQSARRKAGG